MGNVIRGGWLMLCILMTMLTLLAGTSCAATPAGMMRTGKIDVLVEVVATRHNHYVSNDHALSGPAQFQFQSEASALQELVQNNDLIDRKTFKAAADPVLVRYDAYVDGDTAHKDKAERWHRSSNALREFYPPGP